MAYSTVYLNGRKPNMVRRFVVDAAADLSEINISQLLPGSTAFVIESSETYMLNNQYEWVKVALSGGSIIYDGGTVGQDTDIEVIYDGGVEQ